MSPPLEETLFPGPWEKYIAAPEVKEKIPPSKVWKVVGDVSSAAGFDGEEGIVIGAGGTLTVEFEQNIGGRVCFDVRSVHGGPTVNLAYSESAWYAGPIPDATTDRQARDLPLPFAIGNQTGTVCVGSEFVRGAFKYLSITLPAESGSEGEDGSAEGYVSGEGGQKPLGHGKRPKKPKKPTVHISSLWVNCTAFPSQTHGRAYTGYFQSSSNLLNRIWYAGAWTAQLSTVDPKEGGALIDYNRLVDQNESPVGSWYSNFTISNGSAVTTDGAKRDRMVYAGDMYIAVPGIAFSTYDMDAVRNALEVLYDHQYGDGSLPYAGPPMGWHGEFSDTYHMHTLLGTYNYVLFSGDVDWLRAHWSDYLRALRISTAKVDAFSLFHVSSTADWLRPGLTGHTLEASAILFAVLSKTQTLASWLSFPLDPEWALLKTVLEDGLARLYCPDTGLFADNVGHRGCFGSDRVDPQDGNSWALISGLDLTPSGTPWYDPKSPLRSNISLPTGPPTPRNISANLRARWTKHGAPAVEFPNVISPFASGFELLAHCAAGDVAAAVELTLLEWGYLLEGEGFTNSTLAEGFRIDGFMQYPAYWSPARNSHAHGWSAGPTGVLVSDVLGIRLTGPGGSEWTVRPELTRWLGWARGGFATVEGRFEVKTWRAVEYQGVGGRGRTGRRAVISEMSAPAGTKGTVRGAGGEEFDFARAAAVENGQGRVLWVSWEEEDEEMGAGAPSVQMVVKTRDGGDDEDWYRNMVVTTVSKEGNTELRYDDEFVEPEMEERAPGVVDWSVMEKHFKTPPPEGFTLDSLRAEADQKVLK
ncbi:Six-hairpin glycosidase-like protein [Lasiosphaeris hirsuta]|uniref:Six-hairpin glycosidase-like protein n=1 Tax=Lasiosphaeris hirsuta TaxID=260670 RepID=A0AA40APW0_9PEZI|nr:Six-hairpin glycosidase-like protein [Lasiosphaeris hirsuta]